MALWIPPKPTNEEMKRVLLETRQHVDHEECFLIALKEGLQDLSERPHDITGPGSKLLWEFLKGAGLQYRPEARDHRRRFFRRYVLPSILFHNTQQNHHLKWNLPNPNDITKPHPLATEADMWQGAIDTICSLLQDRGYQGGSNSYLDIWLKRLPPMEPHKRKWVREMIPRMIAVDPQPDMSQIERIVDPVNIGLPERLYGEINERFESCIIMLEKDHGYTGLRD